MAEDASSISSSPKAASIRKVWDLIRHQYWFLDLNLCSCLCRWMGFSPTVFLLHLHFCYNNNRCTALKEIKLGDPQLQINKKQPTTRESDTGTSQPKQEMKKINKQTKKKKSSQSYQHIKREGSLIGQSKAGCLQTYMSSV